MMKKYDKSAKVNSQFKFLIGSFEININIT